MFKCPHCGHLSATVPAAWRHHDEDHPERSGFPNWPDSPEVWVRVDGPGTMRRKPDPDDFSMWRAIRVALGIAPRPDMTPQGRLRRVLRAIRNLTDIRPPDYRD